MNPIFAAALEVQAACREEGLRFCFIGGLAVQRWGEPRLSVDVDLTVSTALGEEEGVVAIGRAGARFLMTFGRRLHCPPGAPPSVWIAIRNLLARPPLAEDQKPVGAPA